MYFLLKMGMLVAGTVPWPLCISQENSTTVHGAYMWGGAVMGWGGVGMVAFLALAHM